MNNNIICQTFLKEDSVKDSVWDEHRGNAQQIDNMLFDTPLKRYSERINSCSRNLSFSVDDKNSYHLHSAYFCKVRTCPVCQWRRSMRNYARFMERIPEIFMLHSGLKFLHLVLTVKNCPLNDLKTTLKGMSESWKRLRHVVRFSNAVEGYIRATEVTRSEDGTAHPHYHVLLAVNPGYFKHKGVYITQSDWVLLWRRSARLDYDPQVYVRRVKDFESSAREVLKYSTKPEDLTQDVGWLTEYIRQVAHMRFIEAGGCFSGILRDEITNSEMINTGDEPVEIRDVVDERRYAWDTKNYKRATTGEGC